MAFRPPANGFPLVCRSIAGYTPKKKPERHRQKAKSIQIAYKKLQKRTGGVLMTDFIPVRDKHSFYTQGIAP